jgi:hypothetical protein
MSDQLTPISKAQTLEEIAEFWETHDLTDYEDQTHEVDIEVRAVRRKRVTLAPDLAAQVADLARRQGVSVETLVNLWIAERIHTSP